MSNNWIDSLERAVEVTEGQIALARATERHSLAMEVKQAQKLLDNVATTLERAVVEAAIAWYGDGSDRYDFDITDEALWKAVDALVAARKEAATDDR